MKRIFSSAIVALAAAFCFAANVNAQCLYISGDINGDGDATPLADPFYAAMEVNGNCGANGIDITYFVAFLKGLQPSLKWCLDCPPGARGVAKEEGRRVPRGRISIK